MVAAPARRPPLHACPHERGAGHGPDRIAIFRGGDLAFLEAVGVDDINHDLVHAGVIARYRTWRQRHAPELSGAGGDWIQARIRRARRRLARLPEEVSAFRPDALEQGVADVAALAKRMRGRREPYLWRD